MICFAYLWQNRPRYVQSFLHIAKSVNTWRFAFGQVEGDGALNIYFAVGAITTSDAVAAIKPTVSY